MVLFLKCISVLTLFGSFIVTPISAKELSVAERFYAEANKSYDDGNREEAKALYLQASKYGLPEAHFALGYRYNLDPNQKIYHLETASELGHEKATSELFENLFTRPNSLFTGNPAKALLLLITKNEPAYLSQWKPTLSLCLKAGSFDAVGFLKRFDEYEDYQRNKNKPYSGWLLAEKASIGSYGNKPDNSLALKIVCRSANVPAELQAAVKFLSDTDLKKVNKPFNICNHITSGMGQSFCAQRNTRVSERSIEIQVQELEGKLSPENSSLLKRVLNLGFSYIENKVKTEEQHAGSGRGGWVAESIGQQKQELLSFLNNVAELKHIGSKPNYKEVEFKVAFLLKEVLANLSERPVLGDGSLSLAQVLDSQERWENYAAEISKLLFALDSQRTELQWKAYMYAKRAENLESLLYNISGR
ncbi:hypothetical protein N9L35_01985 [Alphaproteobacteria bacterium]|nr:hypothetical protein [Alphaproteobacteria bacterium]